MQKLASEIAESAYKATAAAERCKTRAEIVDERLDTAAGHTQVGLTDVYLIVIDLSSILEAHGLARRTDN